MLDELPTEVLLFIITNFLNVNGCCHLRQTSKHLKNVVDKDGKHVKKLNYLKLPASNTIVPYGTPFYSDEQLKEWGLETSTLFQSIGKKETTSRFNYFVFACKHWSIPNVLKLIGPNINNKQVKLDMFKGFVASGDVARPNGFGLLYWYGLPGDTDLYLLLLFYHYEVSWIPDMIDFVVDGGLNYNAEDIFCCIRTWAYNVGVGNLNISNMIANRAALNGTTSIFLDHVESQLVDQDEYLESAMTGGHVDSFRFYFDQKNYTFFASDDFYDILIQIWKRCDKCKEIFEDCCDASCFEDYDESNNLLKRAAQQDCIELCKYIVEEYNPTNYDQLLLIAVERDNIELCRLAIEKFDEKLDAAIKAIDEDDEFSPIICASKPEPQDALKMYTGKNPDLINYLIKQK